MNKRVHEIAKERGLAPKEVLQRLQAAGMSVKAVSSSVDEADARRVLGDGDGAAPAAARERSAPAAPKAAAPKAAAPKADAAKADAPTASAPADGGGRPEAAAQRPRDGAPEGTPQPESTSGPAARADSTEIAHKRPTRDSLQGERAPGSAGGRRRVVIDSQASRRTPGGGAPAQSIQPPRRRRRGRRRRGVDDELAGDPRGDVHDHRCHGGWFTGSVG